MHRDEEVIETGVRICTFACGDHGQHYTIPIWASNARMKKFLGGQSDREAQNALVCRASTEYLDDVYTLIAFGAKGQPKTEKGILSATKFHQLLDDYKGYAGKKYDIYLIRHRSGELVSFQERDDPFLRAFGIRAGSQPSYDL